MPKMKLKNQQEIEKDLNNSLNNYCCVTPRELVNMSEKERLTLISLVYKNGEYKFHTIGVEYCEITNFRDGFYKVQWGDSAGDPTIYVSNLNESIEFQGDGVWDYTLLKNKENK